MYSAKNISFLFYLMKKCDFNIAEIFFHSKVFILPNFQPFLKIIFQIKISQASAGKKLRST